MRRFAVIGLGRFGSKLAIALSMSGAEVIAIDKNREVVDLIRDQVGHAVRLDSTDEEALRAQGVHNVDVAIIGMGQKGFEDAILTVVTLRQMGVQQVYARAESRPGFLQGRRHRSHLSRARIGPALGLQADRPPDRGEDRLCAGVQPGQDRGAGEFRRQDGDGPAASPEI
ncbi:MAG TPA: NAD-binding protein [Sedimentisphaerales bacterium]|nr:NAD-binding protein [Sedimentisphaerales bacterium]